MIESSVLHSRFQRITLYEKLSCITTRLAIEVSNILQKDLNETRVSLSYNSMGENRAVALSKAVERNSLLLSLSSVNYVIGAHGAVSIVSENEYYLAKTDT
jgi:hypothetical protein